MKKRRFQLATALLALVLAGPGSLTPQALAQGHGGHDQHPTTAPTPKPVVSPSPKASPSPATAGQDHGGHGQHAAPNTTPQLDVSPRPPSLPTTPTAPRPQGVTQPNLMPQPDWPSPVADMTIFDLLLFELLEYRPNPGQGAVEWDAVGWWGTDFNRLWLKSEGEWALGAGPDVGVEAQALYGHLVAPFYDFQVGLRADRVWGKASAVSRIHGVIGLQGLSPGYFEVEPALFLDHEGRLAARLTASRDLLLTQRAVLQARMETNAALQSAEAFGVGAGWNDLELGIRLRYEFWREFAPYVGVNWNMRFGETAAIARRHGEEPSHLSIVAGVRAWY